MSEYFGEKKLYRAENIISTEQANEAVLMDLTSGVYHGLNTVGNSIWNLLETPKSASEIISALLEEYDVDEQECTTQVNQFLTHMLDEKLIQIGNE